MQYFPLIDRISHKKTLHKNQLIISSSPILFFEINEMNADFCKLYYMMCISK